ncbi:hypothetical protein C7B76_02735 [filamentous cyanobacterium CCP2]|nr:hypothetical protein C7B76_02735 [filamentous cyanobacterium CCP2]
MGATGSGGNEQPIAEFNTLIQDAFTQPMQANLKTLHQRLDLALTDLPKEQVLKIAGEAVAQLAEICAIRADLLLNEWQSRYQNSSECLVEPVLSDELLAGVLRHTMTLHLNELLEEGDPQRRDRRSGLEGSVVGDVEKGAVLEMVEQIELKRAALQTAYEESISTWSATVRQWLQAQPQPVNLESILREVQLLPIQIWLGLLLSDPSYQWEHHWQTVEEFYCSRTVWIRMASEDTLV